MAALVHRLPGAAGDGEPAEPRAQKSQAAFRTISEVAEELDVAQHVLRFWESKFPQVRPLKRGGGRRYYRPEDVELLRLIRSLLYQEGYTIKGAQKLLRGRRVRPSEEEVERPSTAAPSAQTAVPPPLADQGAAPDPRLRLASLRQDLVELKALLARTRAGAG